MIAQIKLQTPDNKTGLISIAEPSVMAVARNTRYLSEAQTAIKAHYGIDPDAEPDPNDMSDGALIAGYVYVWAALKACMTGFEIQTDDEQFIDAELPPEWAEPVAFCENMPWSAFLEIRRVISEISSGALIGRLPGADDSQKKLPAVTTTWLTS